MSEETVRTTLPIKAELLRPDVPDWETRIDQLRSALGAPNNPELFPPHFIKRTFPSIGGGVAEYSDTAEFLGSGFVFPRVTTGETSYTLRFHPVSPKLSSEDAIQSTAKALTDANGVQPPIHLYIPSNYAVDKASRGTVWENGLRIERTPPQNGAIVRDLQKAIWTPKSDDFLYPADMHSDQFALPTSLLAYVDGVPVGFLFGFDKLCFVELPEGLRGLVSNTTLREESQLMGLLENYRGKGIATKLKIQQAREAIERGIEIINWTYDPLLYDNAQLNLSRLGGLVHEFHPNYYAFSGANDLNKVSASRFNVSWFISSPRVQEAMTTRNKAGKFARLKTALLKGSIPVINSTHSCGMIEGKETRVVGDTYLKSVESPLIAIEIPADWYNMQKYDLELALQWRAVTDAILADYIGNTGGKYAITDVVALNADDADERPFLIGKPIGQIQTVFLGED